MSCTQETRGPRRPVEISYFARIKPTHSMVSDNDVQPLVVNLNADNRESIVCSCCQRATLELLAVQHSYNVSVVTWIPAAMDNFSQFQGCCMGRH
jgi:hypothetical protein